MTEFKTNFYHIRFRPSVRKIASDIAETENRSVANYIEWLILRDAASRSPTPERQEAVA